MQEGPHRRKPTRPWLVAGSAALGFLLACALFTIQVAGEWTDVSSIPESENVTNYQLALAIDLAVHITAIASSMWGLVRNNSRLEALGWGLFVLPAVGHVVPWLVGNVELVQPIRGWAVLPVLFFFVSRTETGNLGIWEIRVYGAILLLGGISVTIIFLVTAIFAGLDSVFPGPGVRTGNPWGFFWTSLSGLGIALGVTAWSVRRLPSEGRE